MATVSDPRVPPRSPTSSTTYSRPLSALDSFIPSTSTLSDSAHSAGRSPHSPSSHPPHLLHLAAQVLHNLQYQHDWTSLSLHTHRPPTHPSTPASLLPRPLISGLPPHRLYTHPDEQVEQLVAKEQRRNGRKHRKRSSNPRSGSSSETAESATNANDANVQDVSDDAEESEDEDKPTREWVLPSHINEKWSLRMFAETFDAIEARPPEESPPASASGPSGRSSDSPEQEMTAELPLLSIEDGAKTASRGIAQGERPDPAGTGEAMEPGGERNTKRVLLGTVNDDSTIVYYIVHDGLVKPRQN